MKLLHSWYSEATMPNYSYIIRYTSVIMNLTHVYVHRLTYVTHGDILAELDSSAYSVLQLVSK